MTNSERRERKSPEIENLLKRDGPTAKIITDEQVVTFVRNNIGAFHDKKLESLQKLKLDILLRRKNPYLFKSKNITTIGECVKSLLDAYLSSQEETLFGNFLENLAIYVAVQVHEGWKSTATGIDLEFVNNQTRYLVSIKSGPNWGNSSQINKMKEHFKNAQKLIRQNNTHTHIVSVNGCCYGRDNKPDKGDYFKWCGQEFWTLISGDESFYTRIIEPLGTDAKQRNERFHKNYAAVINRFTNEFSQMFCDESGNIDWESLVKFSSQKNQ